MEIATDTILLIMLFFVIAVLAYIYYLPSWSDKRVAASARGPIPLKPASEITTAKQAEAFYMHPEGSFQAFFYLNPAIRTGAYSVCGSEKNQASCKDGKFAPCACGGTSKNDCTGCKHLGYETLVSIAGVAAIEALIAPDASRQGKAMIQLLVKTESSVTETIAGVSKMVPQSYIETIPLPHLPLQKWTMITISREGRRFDVFFNNEMVLSTKTMYMPISDYSKTNLKGVVSGSDSIMGEVALVNMESRRLSTSEVASQYSYRANSRGTPYTSSDSPSKDAVGLYPAAGTSVFDALSSIRAPTVNLCPEGGCLDAAASVRPVSGLLDWTSPLQ